MNIYRKNKKLFSAVFLVVFVVGFVFLNTDTAHASIGSSVLGAFKSGIEWVLKGILTAMGYVLSAAISLLIGILDPKNVNMTVGNPLVYTVWTQVRDVLNVAFILGLLFSAFCTVFQVSKFNYKSMLLTIILMALLVNFSFPIARIIIDFSNVIMYYLLNSLGFKGANGGIFSQLATNGPLDNIVNAKSPAASGDGSLSYLITAIIFTFIFAVTLLVLAVLFVIRLVALTFLVIFSPIAFVGSIIPFLSSKASGWWDSLFKYSFFGPIMVFMLYVSLKMMEATQQFGNGVSPQTVAGQTVEPGLVAALAMFAVPIVILWGGMGVAQSMSITGAGAVVGRGQKFIRGTGKWMGHKIDRDFLAAQRKRGSKHKFLKPLSALQYLSPTAAKTAWKQRQEEIERRTFAPVTGAWRDKMNRFMSLGKEKTKYRDAHVQTNIAQYEKEAESVSRDFKYLYNQLKSAQKSGNAEKVAAILRIIASNNDLNELLPKEGKVFNPDNTREHLYKMLQSAGFSDENAAKQLSDIGEIAYSKGNYQLYGMGHFDVDKGKYIKSDANFQREAALTKSTNIKAQTKADLWHWNSFLSVDKDGNTDIHDFGWDQIDNITGSDIEQLTRVRSDFVKRLQPHFDKIKQRADNARSAGEIDKADRIDAFYNKLLEQQKGKSAKSTPAPASGGTAGGGATP